MLCPYVLFSHSCGQNQTNVPKDNIKAKIKDIVTSYLPNMAARNIKKGRNGTILIAGYLLVFSIRWKIIY